MKNRKSHGSFDLELLNMGIQLSEEEPMRISSEKKKLEFSVLESHAINWAIDRLDEAREIADNVNSSLALEVQKDLRNKSIAFEAFNLLELLKPLRHSHESLICWAEEFTKEYYDKAYDRPAHPFN